MAETKSRPNLGHPVQATRALEGWYHHYQYLCDGETEAQKGPAPGHVTREEATTGFELKAATTFLVRGIGLLPKSVL